MVDLVGSHQGVVDAAHHGRDRVCWIQALVGIGLAGEVAVGGDLPTGQVDGVQSATDHLDGLVARQRPQRAGEGLGLQLVPQLLGSQLRQCLLFDDGATKPDHVFGAVAALDAGPPYVTGPLLTQQRCAIGQGGAAVGWGGSQGGGHDECSSSWLSGILSLRQPCANVRQIAADTHVKKRNSCFIVEG